MATVGAKKRTQRSTPPPGGLPWILIGGALAIAAVVALALFPAGDPLERLQPELDRYPEYSLVLADMREEGTFSTDYWH